MDIAITYGTDLPYVYEGFSITEGLIKIIYSLQMGGNICIFLIFQAS